MACACKGGGLYNKTAVIKQKSSTDNSASEKKKMEKLKSRRPLRRMY